jgi:4-diphosphocytidyl-2-C-methyl-D-erythritol kinase
MVVFPNAKINLGLDVVEKRPDGYHNIETIFYPIGLCDVLEAVESDKFELTLSGIDIGGSLENNLVAKAYQLLKKDFGIPPVKVHLHKAIPTGAGLGGGSSDGAFMLKLLNKLFNLGIENRQLEIYAGRLGADCPFFIENTPAFATGLGNILAPIKIDLSGYSIVLVKPPFGVNTANAYKNVVPSLKEGHSLKNLVKLPVKEWNGYLENDFELPVFEFFPEIRQIKEKLYGLGALFASMTGSGSSVFGIFTSRPTFPDAYFRENYFIYPYLLHPKP